ncbi:sphingomyelin phosphodiesterase-like [Aricia agestis]|uniref:sphingomyelin phosphodiesterase-like n=1 Tax=Aricia agestis TaxID=91739 RepID=UPI001C2028C4|nr:sphingomyelin phosphodiesterase-like [Aricia agestis]
MKLFIFMFLFVTSSLATHLLTPDDLQELFIKFARKELSQSEIDVLTNVLKVYYSQTPNSRISVERSNIQCLICRSGVSALFELVRNGAADDELIDAATVMCSALGIVSPNACQGVIELNAPIFTYIISSTPELTPATACGLLLQNVGNDVCNYDDPRFEWEVDLPAPIESEDVEEVQTEDANPLTVVLITDAHIDPYYEPFGVADCDEPTCCRTGQRPRTTMTSTDIDEEAVSRSILTVNNELVLDVDALSSVVRTVKHAVRTNSEPAGYWGDWRNCDSPIWAYDDVIDRIASAHQNIDIVYYLGDSIDHHVWETTYDMINDVNLHIIEKMRSSFGEDVPILPVIGNHESQPTNQFAPSSVVGDKLNTTWLYEALANKWDHYLTEEAKETVRERGEFSILAKPKLRVISINNNVAYRNNWWVMYDPTDAKKHLDWLVEELYKAELAGEKVHILGHIPPGVHDFFYTWTREYNKIVNRFSSTIAAEFNGHVHSDEFKIFYNDAGNPINVAWGAGAATTYSNYNLNYKIATIDPESFGPLNIANYVYNLTEANLTPNRSPHWFQLYDFKNSFELQDLSPSSMNALVNSMVTDKKYLLDLYSAYYFKISDASWPWCNEQCKVDNLCKSVVTVLWERQRCEQLHSLFFS